MAINLDGHLFGTDAMGDGDFYNEPFSGLWEHSFGPGTVGGESRVNFNNDYLILEITYEQAKTWLFHGIYNVQGTIYMYEESGNEYTSAEDDGDEEGKDIELTGWRILKEGLTLKDMLDALLVLARKQVDDEAIFEATKAVQGLYNELLAENRNA